MALFLAGCAPAYHTGAIHAPVFDGPQQVSALGFISESGLHLAAAYAPVNHFAIRVRAQTRPFDAGEKYWLVAAGVEGFEAATETMRVSVAAELGYGRVDAFDSVTLFTTTSFSSNGALLQVAVPVTLAWDLDIITVGGTARAVVHTIYNDVQWAGTTQGTLGIVEGLGFFRVGGVVAFETQVGVSIPVYQNGDVASGYFPVHIGMGVALDLDLKKRVSVRHESL